jgi:hypothetical protein
MPELYHVEIASAHNRCIRRTGSDNRSVRQSGLGSVGQSKWKAEERGCTALVQNRVTQQLRAPTRAHSPTSCYYCSSSPPPLPRPSGPPSPPRLSQRLSSLRPAWRGYRPTRRVWRFAEQTTKISGGRSRNDCSTCGTGARYQVRCKEAIL